MSCGRWRLGPIERSGDRVTQLDRTHRGGLRCTRCLLRPAPRSSPSPPASAGGDRGGAISGPAAGVALEKLIGRVPEPRKAALARVRDPASGEVIDEALRCGFPAPHSETGEDVAELQLHGGHAVIAGGARALGRIEGCRLAEPGEFTRRAFENGQLDLTAVEGLADLIAAETRPSAGRRSASSRA